jgi:hypothetical protein
VYNKVKEMFKIQYEHAEKCGKILNQLFQIKMEDGQAQIQLHPRIIKEGFPAINEINAQARELLIKYYTNCEKAYVQGMEIIITDVTEKGNKRTAQAQAQAKAQAQAQAKALQVRDADVTKGTVKYNPIAPTAPTAPTAPIAKKKQVTFKKNK